LNIVYALSGEGRGHGSLGESRIACAPKSRPSAKNRHLRPVTRQLEDYDVLPIRGIKHYYDRHSRLSLLRSIVKNAGVLSYYVSNWKTIRRQLKDFSPTFHRKL